MSPVKNLFAGTRLEIPKMGVPEPHEGDPRARRIL